MKVIIYSKFLIDIVSIPIGFLGKSKAVFIPPFFIILRYHEYAMNEIWINHELIHQIQFIETLGLVYPIMFFEYWYNRIIKKMSNLEANKNQTNEKEAYMNQDNLDYLKKRRLGTYWRLLFKL